MLKILLIRAEDIDLKNKNFKNNEFLAHVRKMSAFCRKMSACSLFSNVFKCDIFTMDKEMRKAKTPQQKSPISFAKE